MRIFVNEFFFFCHLPNQIFIFLPKLTKEIFFNNRDAAIKIFVNELFFFGHLPNQVFIFLPKLTKEIFFNNRDAAIKIFMEKSHQIFLVPGKESSKKNVVEEASKLFFSISSGPAPRSLIIDP